MRSSSTTTRILSSLALLKRIGIADGFSATVRLATTTNSQSLSSSCLFSTTTAKPAAAIHTPVGIDGQGSYTADTKGCFDVIDATAPLVLSQISGSDNALPIRKDRPVRIADYGTADAGTSLGLLTQVVQSLRQRNDVPDDKECVLHYEDQCGNEWKSVFQHALGLQTVTDAYGNAVPCPYDLGNVFVEACGVAFHAQCYPSESIDLGVSFTAMHWLSAAPASLRGTEYMHSSRLLAQGKEAPAAEQKQAADDWNRILDARARELAPGGRLVCANFCTSADGYFLGQTDVGASMWDSFQSAWNKLHEQDMIDEDERLGVSFPNYYRTMDEFVAGIDQHPDLQLISAEEKIVRCPYREQYVQQDEKEMSPQEYAKAMVPTTRTWSHSTFKDALGSHRSEEEKEELMAKFWKNYEDLVAEDPKAHGMDYVHCYMVVEKKA